MTLAGAVGMVGLVIQGADLFNRGWAVVQKLYNYEYEKWEWSDYLEVSLEATIFATGAISWHADGKAVLIERDITQIKQLRRACKGQLEALANDPQIPSSTREDFVAQLLFLKSRKTEALSTLKALADHPPLEAAYMGIAATFCQNGCKKWDGSQKMRSIADILSSPDLLYRIGQAAEYQGDSGTRQICSSLSNISSGIRNPDFIAFSQRFYQHCYGLILDYSLSTALENGNYNILPECYENNPVFSQYKCGITLTIIRYPVAIQDGSALHYYEFAALHEWVAAWETNPLTREPLDLSTVRVDKTALRQIETEMLRLGIPLH